MTNNPPPFPPSRMKSGGHKFKRVRSSGYFIPSTRFQAHSFSLRARYTHSHAYRSDDPGLRDRNQIARITGPVEESITFELLEPQPQAAGNMETIARYRSDETGGHTMHYTAT